MLECLIIGDSIAQGVAALRPECAHYTQVGINSKDFNHKHRVTFSGDTVIISLGTNDNKYVDTYQELIKLRLRIESKRVIWILPHAVNPKSGSNIEIVQASVQSIADAQGDIVVKIPEPTADNYHPTGKGYRELAKETK